MKADNMDLKDKVNDVAQLGNALHRAVSTDLSRLRSMRNEARNYAQKYLWPPIADRYRDLQMGERSSRV
jgi:hypothetical protein